jgi:hypothetical protein
MGPSPAKLAFGVTHIGLWQPPCIMETCYFRAKKETRKVPMFGGAYRCVCLLIFEIWCYTMRGSWFRSVSTWGVQEGLIWSVSNLILLLLSCCLFDRRERLGQTPFGSCWSVSSWYQICRVYHGEFIAEIYQLKFAEVDLCDWSANFLPRTQRSAEKFCYRRQSAKTPVLLLLSAGSWSSGIQFRRQHCWI